MTSQEYRTQDVYCRFDRASPAHAVLVRVYRHGNRLRLNDYFVQVSDDWAFGFLSGWVCGLLREAMAKGPAKIPGWL